MTTSSSSVAMAGAPQCRHCGGTLWKVFFDASGRIDVPHRKFKDFHVSVPVFRSYTRRDEREGRTPAPAIVCPRCDGPDALATPENVSAYLNAYWWVETGESPPRPVDLGPR